MMHLRSVLLVLVTACVPPAARETPDRASGLRLVHAGDTVRGILPGEGPRLGNRGVFQAYRLSADSGASYRVSVTSTAFDPVVRIGRLIGGVPDIVAEDDDSGEGLNALAALTAPSTGEYFVIVHASGGSDSGAFDMSITSSAAGAGGTQTDTTLATSARAVRLGEIVRDTLRGTAFYTFRASAGQNIRLNLTSGEFDTFLSLGRIIDGAFRADTTDDDGGDGLNSLLELTVPADAEYAARVTSVGTGQGPFTLRLIDKANPPALAPVATRPVTIGTELSGTLDDSSATLESSAAFDQWELAAVSGAAYVVTLSSDAFDPLLSIGELRANRYHELWRNDDAPGLGRASRVTFTAARTGPYLIRPQPLQRGLGRYTLLVHSRQAGRATPVTNRVPASGEAAGTLGNADARLPDGSLFQHWVFSARRGERVTLVLRGVGASSRSRQAGRVGPEHRIDEDFDPFLAVGVMDGSRFVELSSNDDFGDGTNARVVFVAPTTGDYVARVNTFGPEQSGEYSLRLERGR